ncbi:head maturation protease, ClpP-related [Micromonospora sp. CA-246542]|uniref:head maturation protease, ClpP-related n=1 Tax=Micromonospora sp. CA-246542 TaxID=3239959 RepID=UPI003D90549C
MRQPNNLCALRAAWRNASDDIKPRETPCFRMEDGEVPKLYVYDVIGGWDNDSADFVKAVHAIKSPAIDMHINSPGGFVYDAVAMFEAVKSHPARVTTHIDGLAASAASFLAMAGDTVEIAKGGRMMIHDAQGVVMGGPAEMREYADLFDEVSNDIAGYYADRAGGASSTWRKAMTATTWYSAQQAVDAGLADRVTDKKTKSEPENRASQLIRARARVALGGVN